MYSPILKFEFNKNHYYDNSWIHEFSYEDSYGNLLSKEKYKYAKSFNEGYAFVYKYDKSWDIINAIGESVLKKFRFSKVIKIALKHVCPKNEFFIKNYIIGDNLIISVDCSRLKNEFDALNIKVKGYPKNINRQGCLLINIHDSGLLYSLIEDYSLSGNGLIAIKHFDMEWVYISVESFNHHWLEKYEFQEKYEFACGFKNGLAKVKKDGYFGYIDTNGGYVIPAIYDDARSFSKGLASVAIANCRKVDNWNKGPKYSDFAWNLIDKSNKCFLAKTKDNLSMVDDKLNYYYQDKTSMYECGYENLNPNYFNELSKEGITCFNYYQDRPHVDFWYNSNVFGQFSPSYLVDFLTAQISEELGFKKWFGDMSHPSNSAYNILHSREKVVAETLYTYSGAYPPTLE